MRILQVSKAFPPVIGGIERHVATLSRFLARKDHQVTVLVCNQGLRREALEWEGVRVIRVPSPGKISSMHLGPTTPLWLRKCPADLIHFHLPYPMGPVATFLVRPRIPILVTWHSDIVRQRTLLRFYRPLRSWFLRRAFRILATSPNLAENSPGLSPFLGKTRIVPLGIDRERFVVTPTIRNRIREIQQEMQAPTVLFVGRLVPYKGIEFLLQAMIDVEARLIVIGGGKLRRKLENMTADLGLLRKVVFRGEVTDEEVCAHLHACECLVLPSVGNNEAFGLVQLEAMACGKPVISTKLPTGVSFVNVDGETGLSVAPRDSLALAYALKALLQDPALGRAMGNRGRMRIERDFDAETMTGGILRHYEDALAETGHP